MKGLKTLKRRILVVVALASCGASLGAGQPRLPAGPEFRVNSNTTGLQRRAAVAMAPEGDFVVVWESVETAGGDTSLLSIQAQRFSARGELLGEQFLVNEQTLGNQHGPDVATDEAGNFLVVWADDGEGGDPRIIGSRYAADGKPLRSEFPVSTDSWSVNPAVAMMAGGEFVVVWRNSNEISGQRFAANADPVGGEFMVNTYTLFEVLDLTVAMAPEGDFIVAWTGYASEGDDTSGRSIQARRFAADGSPQGSDFQVNTVTLDHQQKPDLIVGPDGEFTVAWESYVSAGSDISGASIQARRFDAAGIPAGPEFQVNNNTDDWQGSPAIAVAENGGFVVSWTDQSDESGDPECSGIQAREFAPDGEPVGDQVPVNTTTAECQWESATAMSRVGNFVVVWGDRVDSEYEIWGQRFGSTVFEDGFESGDTSAWSVVLP